MKKAEKPCCMTIFPSRIGWFAMLVEGDRIKELTFGHKTSVLAKKALSADLAAGARLRKTCPKLVRRLQAFANGTAKDDFRDIRLDLGQKSDFQRRVLNVCRKIPYGTTLSYAELAELAGFPGASRAVGNCMASNNLPILIPCHRVVCSNGSLGSYSAPGGTRMKKRLLALELA
jgi:methylated-DNA-[protein]-cysteine S-methyltransferase